MKPPIGVRVIAALQLVGAVGLTVEAVDLFVDVSKGKDVGAVLIIELILRLIGALISIALAIGLWNLSPFARYFTLIFCTFSLLFAPIILGTYFFQQHGAAFTATLVGVALSSWTLWYLFRPHVKAAFHATRPSAEAPQV
jgi:hypothetical protein